MRGQISIEYLFLALVMLAAISFSIAALGGIRDYAEGQQKQIKLAADAGRVLAAIESVCALGDGNSRIIEISGQDTISGTNEGFGISDIGDIIYRNTTCQVEGSGKGKIILENEGGKIKINK